MKKSFIFSTLLAVALCGTFASTIDIVDLSPRPGTQYPVPEKYKGMEIFELVSKNFSSIASLKTYGLKLVDDADSVDGKAMGIELPGKSADPEKYHQQDFVMGVQGRVSQKALAWRKIKRIDMPQDEKFHFYSLGKVTLESKTLLWGHQQWSIQQELDRYYNENDSSKNNFEVLISIKFAGPAYVQNSSRPDGIYVDRILLIRR